MPELSRSRRLTAVFQSVRVFKMQAKSNVASDVAITNVTLWRPPIQISCWGKPADREVEWSALFFDLIYVAAMYKLGTMVSEELMNESPDHHIFLEFSGLALQLILGWHLRTMFDARFITKDAFHYFTHTLEIFVIALAIAYVPSDSDGFYNYRHDKSYIRGVARSLAIFHILQLLKWTEVACCNIGEGATYFARLMAGHSVTFILAQAAVLLLLPHASLTTLSQEVSIIWVSSVIMYAIALWYFVSVYLGQVIQREGAPGVHRKAVPLAVGFMLHRLGEWTMLLLGESVLSMLNTVEATHNKNMLFFVQSMAIIFCLYFLSFSTYPHDENQHVMRRSRTSGIKYWIIVSFLLPLALVCAATGAKALQKLHNYKVTKGTEYFQDHYDTKEATRFFCFGLQSSFACVTLMSLYHTVGPYHYLKDLFCSSVYIGTRARRYVMYFFVMRVLTMVLMNQLALVNLLPQHTMLTALLIVLTQAGLVATENPESIVVAHEEHLSMASTHRLTTGIHKTDQVSTASVHNQATCPAVADADPHEPIETKVRFEGDVEVEEGGGAAMCLASNSAKRGSLDFRSSEMGLHMAASEPFIDVASPTVQPTDEVPKADARSPFHL